MLGLGTGIHEIAIKFKDLKFASEEGHPFWEKYSRRGNEALSWMKLLPQLRAVFKMSQFSFYFGGVVLFALVAFGIINTLFMSLYERMFEFGVIRAIGTRPGGIRKLIVLEAGCLGLLSILIGIILGFVLTFLLTKVGLDSRGIEYAGTTIREMFYPELQFRQYIIYPLWVLGLTMLVGLYPAVVAGRMNISAALRKSL
jgi:ABC-type antimicrobial peptide transport system permease subunit